MLLVCVRTRELARATAASGSTCAEALYVSPEAQLQSRSCRLCHTHGLPCRARRPAFSLRPQAVPTMPRPSLARHQRRGTSDVAHCRMPVCVALRVFLGLVEVVDGRCRPCWCATWCARLPQVSQPRSGCKPLRPLARRRRRAGRHLIRRHPALEGEMRQGTLMTNRAVPRPRAVRPRRRPQPSP